jgi:hypothetical protein
MVDNEPDGHGRVFLFEQGDVLRTAVLEDSKILGIEA